MDLGNGNDDRFMEAVKSGDIFRVNRLLSGDSSLAGKNTQPGSLQTEGFPLFHAARNGDLEMVRFSNREPFLPLHVLAEDFIEPRTYGFKCKQLSTEADLIRLARLFVEYGFDASISHPKTGLTPLQIARNANRMEAAGYFKTQATGADPDCENNT